MKYLNKKNSLVLALLIFVCGSSAIAQDFLLSGALLEKGSKNRIAEARITNIRTGASVSSSNLGLFQIKTQIGDTLTVIKREYSDGQAVVMNAQSLVIYLDRGRTLEEVNITGQSKKNELDDIKRDFRNKGSFHQGKPPFLSFIFTPLTALYELFGKTPKNARRFGRYYDNEMQQTLVDRFFNETKIQNNTDLKGKELEDFMLNYRPEYDKAKNWIEYDAVKYIKDSYKLYTDTLNKKK